MSHSTEIPLGIEVTTAHCPNCGQGFQLRAPIIKALWYGLLNLVMDTEKHGPVVTLRAFIEARRLLSLQSPEPARVVIAAGDQVVSNAAQTEPYLVIKHTDSELLIEKTNGERVWVLTQSMRLVSKSPC